jgi:hypothetical protein
MFSSFQVDGLPCYQDRGKTVPYTTVSLRKVVQPTGEIKNNLFHRLIQKLKYSNTFKTICRLSKLKKCSKYFIYHIFLVTSNNKELQKFCLNVFRKPSRPTKYQNTVFQMFTSDYIHRGQM